MSDPASPSQHAPTPRQRLAAALRPLITLTAAADLDDDAMEAAAAEIEAIRSRLGDATTTERRPRQQPDAGGPAQEYFPTSPVLGTDNPLAPPVTVHVVQGADGAPPEIRADAWFDYAYEGPPTCVHGGVIAEVFDDVLGAANLASGNGGMTGTLTVRYRKPTPLRTALRIEARCTGREGRKILTWGGIYHGDVLTAEAEGIFIEVGPQRFLAIAEGNAAHADPTVLAAIRADASRRGAAADVQGPAPTPETAES